MTASSSSGAIVRKIEEQASAVDARDDRGMSPGAGARPAAGTRGRERNGERRDTRACGKRIRRRRTRRLSTRVALRHGFEIGARASAQLVDVCREHTVERDALARRAVAMQPQRRAERGERHLVDAQRAQQRVVRRTRDRASASRDQPACGPPSSLSPENVTRLDAVGQRIPHGAFARRAVFAQGRPARRCRGLPRPARRRGGRARQLRAADLVREAFDSIVRRMRAQQQRRARREGAFVIARCTRDWSCRLRRATLRCARARRASESRRRFRPAGCARR